MKTKLAILLLAASALTPLAAWAQDAQSSSTVQEVVVTAQKRSEKLQNVPVSITALTAATLNSADVTDERALVRVTPALRMDQTGIFTQPTIRGVGSGVTGPGASANVATYVDGFYQPSEIGNNFDLSNVSQVEVLKGPQGTLFGRNATGGAVLVTTKDPSFTLQGDATASYRSFNDTRGDIYVSGPITDNLAANLSVYGRHSDGWKTDLVTGLHDAPNHTFDIRGKLLYKPTDKIKFLLILQHTDIDDPSAPAYNTYGKNSFANGIPGVIVANGYDNTAMPTPPKNTIEANSIYLKSTIDFDWATLTSYTGYRGENDKEVSQLDRSSLDAFTASWSQSERTFTQEFNLGGKTGNLNWVLGAFYDHDKSGYPHFLFITPGDPAPVVSDAGAAFDKTDAYAVFGDATYEVVQNLYFTGGIRFSDETQDIDYTNTPAPADNGTGSHTWTSVNERAILRYQFAPNTNVYASFSTGFKSGAYNALSYVKVPVNPETIDAYEIGFKTQQSNWSFSGAGYYYDYKNLQFTAYHFIAATDTTPAETVPALVNAKKATIYGLEGQATYNFSHDFDVRIGANLMHSRYDSFPFAGKYVPNVNPVTGVITGNASDPTADASGKTLVRAPAFTLTAGSDYTHDLPYGRLTLSGNVYFTTKIYFDPVNVVSQPDYATLDLKATWTLPGGMYNISVFGDNVTDTRYVTQVAEDVFGYGGVYGDPATFGVQVGAKF